MPPSHMSELMERANTAAFRMVYQNENGTHNANWEYKPEEYFAQYNTYFDKVEANRPWPLSDN